MKMVVSSLYIFFLCLGLLGFVFANQHSFDDYAESQAFGIRFSHLTGTYSIAIIELNEALV